MHLFLLIHIALSGGPVKSEYNFLQFHMHWGDSVEKGSEHHIDNELFAAEVLLTFRISKIS